MRRLDRELVFAAVRARWRAGALIDLLVLAAAFGLKLSYSKAGATDLAWVLAPSCWLAARFGGLELAPELGAGWISHSSHMVVGPACAGVNFLVVAWLALFFSSRARFIGWRRRLAWLGVSLFAAYAATIATNGLRIVLAAHLYGLHIYGALLTKERLHRALGIVLYCGALLALCGTADRYAPTTAERRTARTGLAPLCWYIAVVLGIPLANRAFARDPGRFTEHAVLTLGIAFAVVLLARLFGVLVDRLHSRNADS